MNCEQVTRRLSEYLDRSLDPAARSGLDSHLSTCSHCRAEADLLAECIRQVAQLSELEPPMGFAQRVIAHVKEIETKPSFWDTLFLPFRVNVPVHATALVLIGIIAIYVVAPEPHRRVTAPSRTFSIVDANPETAYTAINRTPALNPQTGNHADEPTSEAAEAPVPDQEGRAAFNLGEQVNLSQRSIEEELFAAKPSATHRFGLATKTAPSVEGSPGVIAPQVSAPVEGRAPTGQKPKLSPAIPVASERRGLSTSAGQIPRPPTDLLEMMGPGGLGLAPLASEFQRLSAATNVQLIVRRRPQSNNQDANDSEGFQKSAAAGGTVGEHTAGRSVEGLLSGLPESMTRQIIWLSIPHHQYDRVRNDLLAIGTIESESRKLSAESASVPAADSPLHVMVIILPAKEAGADRPVALPTR